MSTRGTVAGIEGTEFTLSVEGSGGEEMAKISVIDGRVNFSSDQKSLVLTNGEEAIALFGKPPSQTPGFAAKNLLQWCFYYPAILDVRELSLSKEEESELASSLVAYKSGDVPSALRLFSAKGDVSPFVHVYHAALLLSVGESEQAEKEISALNKASLPERIQRLSESLNELIAATQFRPYSRAFVPSLATECLAASYYEQSQANRVTSLGNALQYARQAVDASPDFGFATVRKAELEFSFGNIRRALSDVDKGLSESPKNAQALALKGFLSAAENNIGVAEEWFDRALAVEPSLGNGWLGRGLCRLRRGEVQRGRQDLMMAAALEPRRASLRSYLGKELAGEGDYGRAMRELQIAQELDPNDPTAYLYSALLLQQLNRINEAVRDLQKSQDLNDNRSVYRSELLLDQDRAVRSANLADVYRDAGMFDVSLREASRAVSYDYENFSAHLFLATSYDQLRDPNRINLRYETPAESEYLIANLLAPVGAGTLSQTISQQEYSKLLERDRVGVVSSTEYLSRGAWIEKGAQFGTFGDNSYAVEGSYRSDPGQRPNNDFEETDIRLHFKHQFSPYDSIYLRAILYSATGGDETQYYYPSSANLGLRTKETQQPILNVGYHHEWHPGVDTIFLASRLSDKYSVSNPSQTTFFLDNPFGAGVSDAESMSASETYQSSTEIYSTELQQLFQTSAHTTIFGGRYQIGDIHTTVSQANPSFLPGSVASFYFDPSVSTINSQDSDSTFQRISFYGYHYWQIVPTFQLAAGISYDQLRYPSNFRAAPITDEQKSLQQLSPKGGFIWSPAKNTAFRFAYTRSVAGAGIDQTFSLEPSQVAGFNQSFRSIIPESVNGTETVAKFETYGLAFEQRIGLGTYIGVVGQILNSDVGRSVGDFEYTGFGSSTFAGPSQTPVSLNYTEHSVRVNLDQLVGDGWSFGAAYDLTQSSFKLGFYEVPNGAAVGFNPTQNVCSTLHQVALKAHYNDPCGFFGEAQAMWFQQDNQGYSSPSLPTDSFWQINLYAGFRFFGRKAEIRAGLLNLAGQDYRLNPLTLYNDLPRSRTASARVQLNF